MLVKKHPHRLQTHLPEGSFWSPGYAPDLPFFSEITTYLPLGRDLGLLVFCTSIRGKVILKIYLKGNELIISTLGIFIMNLVIVDLIEVSEVMSNWKREF